jgi:hypothetical protein
MSGRAETRREAGGERRRWASGRARILVACAAAALATATLAAAMTDDVITVGPMDNPGLVLDADMLGNRDGPFPFVNADRFAAGGPE